MSYRDKCEQLYLENQELKERLKEAKKEIDELYSGRLGACHTCEQVAELNIKLEQQLKEANDSWCEKHEDQIKLMARMTEMQQQLKEAESVIEFYGDVENWYTIETKRSDHTALHCDYNNGHKHARQYLVKYKTNE